MKPHTPLAWSRHLLQRLLAPESFPGSPWRLRCARLGAPTLRLGGVRDVQPGARARAGERLAERSRQHFVRNPGPGPSPTPASSLRRRSHRRRCREVKWGWDRVRPASPAPSGRAKRGAGPDPEAKGARRHLHRRASARRAPASVCPRVGTAPSARARGAGGAKQTRGEPGSGRPGARGAAATAGLGWNASPPASWKPLHALGRPPGVVPIAGIADAASTAAAAGRRVGERRPLRREPAGPPRLSRSRDAGRPLREPPPSAPGRGRRLCSQTQQPQGGLRGTAGSCLSDLGASDLAVPDPRRSPVAPSRSASPPWSPSRTGPVRGRLDLRGAHSHPEALRP